MFVKKMWITHAKLSMKVSTALDASRININEGAG